MKALVTGGTGVVGAAAVRALLAAGHQVRLFSRHAREDAARWRGEVEVRTGSVTSPEEVRFEGTPGHDLRFEVETCDRSATPVDHLAMRTLGLLLKRWTWAALVERTAKAFGSPEPIDVKNEEETLEGEAERQAMKEMERKIAATAREMEPDLQEEARAKVAEAEALKPV